MLHHRKGRRIGAIALAATLLAAAALALTATKSLSAVGQLMSSTCSDSRWCLKLTNASAGRKATAIVGQVDVNTNKNPNPPFSVFTLKAGLRGVDAAASALDTNAGVIGSSTHGNGVVGVTTFDSSAAPFGPNGVSGFDFSKTLNANVGTFGASLHNVGVAGYSGGTITASAAEAFGVIGDAPRGLGGVLGIGNGKPASPSTIAAGVAGVSTRGNGVFAENSSRRQATLVAANTANGPLISAYGNAQHGSVSRVLLLDNAGNLTISGALTTGGQPTTTRGTSSGGSVLTYSAQQTIPSLEDAGEAQLVAGRATVRFDAAFAGAIDARSYLVFITPQGDAGPLYVTQKTLGGFTVRERGGASNVSFDYRIVARPFGSAEPRLPRYSPARDDAAEATRDMVQRTTAAASWFTSSVDAFFRQSAGE